MFDIFKGPEKINIAQFVRHIPTTTAEQRFRQKTVDDIGYLEEAGKKDLAKLEAEKLVKHLTKEFEL